MSRMPARAATEPKSRVERARDLINPPGPKDLKDVSSTDADYRRNKTSPYGGAPEARENPKPANP